MTLKIGDKVITDAPFTLNGVQYPAGWVRLASPAEKKAVGLVELPDPAPVDHRFYWQSGDEDPLPRANEEITAAVHVPRIKAEASALILAAFPDWKQRNMTARGVELLQKQVAGSLTSDETSEIGLLHQAWSWIKSIREHSNALEAELASLDFDALVEWHPHDWPVQS